jgi:hypothetical protein
MPDHLVIEHITLLEVDRERITPPMRRHDVRWHALTVSVKNTSGEPLYVISEIRHIRYDAARRALVLHFAEHDSPPDSVTNRVPFPPRFTIIRPGETGSLTYQLSSPIAFLERTVEGETQVKHVRIPEDVETIECTVAHAIAPPPQAINLVSAEVPTRWADWGTRVTAAWQPPERDSQHKSE